MLQSLSLDTTSMHSSRGVGRPPPGRHSEANIPLYTTHPLYHTPLSTTPPLDSMTDVIENIILSHTSYEGGKNVQGQYI